MFLQGVLLAVCVVVSHVADCAPTGKEKIDIVSLKYQCIHVKQGRKDNNKSPILLIHGVTSNHKDWDGTYQVLSLRTNRRACVVDLRNHGDSPWSNRSDVEAMTADIGNFLDKQKITKVNIIGHSLGGKIAVHYTLNNPERVDSLVVEDMRPNGIKEEAFKLVKVFMEFMKVAIQHVPGNLDEEGAKKFIIGLLQKRLLELNSTQVVDESLARSMTIRQVNGKWEWKTNMNQLYLALENSEKFLTPSTGLYKGPALFIYGTKSPFDVSGDRENIMKMFPNAKLIPVEGAGHNIHGSFRKFNDEVIKLLNR